MPGGRTRVTETWDFANSRGALMYRLLGVHRRNIAGIEGTLRELPRRIPAT
jgi:hypothetical protein